MKHEISWERRGLRVAYHGRITSKALAAVVRTFQGDERYDDLRHIVHDCSDCTGAEYSAADLEELAATDCVAALTNQRVRIAVVATHPEMLALIEQYLSTRLHLHQLRVFANLGQAAEWIESP